MREVKTGSLTNRQISPNRLELRTNRKPNKTHRGEFMCKQLGRVERERERGYNSVCITTNNLFIASSNK